MLSHQALLLRATAFFISDLYNGLTGPWLVTLWERPGPLWPVSLIVPVRGRGGTCFHRGGNEAVPLPYKA